MDSVISRMDVSQTLSKIREIASQTKAFSTTKAVTAPLSPFNHLLSIAKEAVADVSHSQFAAESLQASYLAGDKTTSVSDVMVATMKSKVAFEGLLVVRNKLLEAYKEIMNMPV